MGPFRVLRKDMLFVVPRVGNLLVVFFSESLIFCEKNSKRAIRSKQTSDYLIHSCFVSDLLTVAHFGELFTHSHSFLVSDLTVTHITSLYLKKTEWANCSFFKTYKKYDFIQIFLSESLIFLWAKEQFTQKKLAIRSGCSFVMSDLRDLLMVAHLWWVTWANCSQLIIFV